jgi:hypothetical protein
VTTEPEDPITHELIIAQVVLELAIAEVTHKDSTDNRARVTEARAYIDTVLDMHNEMRGISA